MQRLGWDVIKQRAKDFAAEWASATYEKGETQSFYNDFFTIFGVKRRAVASYEKRVETLDRSKKGFIDLFWPGMLLVEQKSSGLLSDKTLAQALDYVDWLPERDQPRYILTCDFQKWRLLDLETGSETRFTLPQLPDFIERFDFILGRQRTFVTQADVNIKAAELMGRLHDALKAKGYAGHDLERLLVRLLFCLFADDTGIFEPKDIFLQLIDNDTHEDGHDVGTTLIALFDILDTPETQRQQGIRDELNAFPYINGALFAGSVRVPHFDKAMRDLLLDAARFDWRKVSPAIFGSLFQSVMSAKERREKGAHYTSEVNILRVIRPLFLDDLESELASIKARRTGREAALQAFQHKLARLNFLDPACGCGNFLVIAYREIRRLELECLDALYPRASGAGDNLRQGMLGVAQLSLVDVNQFHGIEYEEWPAQIAGVAMWMADHIANIEVAAAFSMPFVRIPLKKSANIVHADALEVDWASVCPPERISFVMGNPPFVGAKFQTPAQREQVRRIAGLPGSGGTLDYVAAWFLKAVAYAGRSQTRVAFVATNSICQGEQVAQLWPLIFRAGWEIAFAHRSFVWNSEARGKAHVHCVIIGLAYGEVAPTEKRLFSYVDGKGDPRETRHNWLTAYLFEARSEATRHLVVKNEKNPINDARRLLTGSKPLDGNHYVFTASEKQEFLLKEPDAASLFSPYQGGDEYINGFERYLLRPALASPDKLARLTAVKERIDQVRDYRATSDSPDTRKLASVPMEWHVTLIPESEYLAIPNVSSERRDYVPIGWISKNVIPNQKLRVLIDASLWEFSILSSAMHMAWMRTITGRMKSDYMYSVGVVYNTFPWPDASEAQREKVSALAQAVLDARANHPTANLAQLYDPLTMPADLRAAHAALDRAVDRLYRVEPFSGDADRVALLFTRYAAMVDPLATTGARANARNARKARQTNA
ncbi:MAG: DNA methyltransferase [Sphingomonadales bacterium]|jgi:hypothetical protein